MEDYVYTYLSKLAQRGICTPGARSFLEIHIRLRRGLACLSVARLPARIFEFDLEESVFTEENWSEIYQIRDKFFPQMEIVGWFLSRMDFRWN